MTPPQPLSPSNQPCSLEPEDANGNQHLQQETEHEQGEENAHQTSEDVHDVDPSEHIDRFDWEGMLQGYSDELEQLTLKEQKLFEDFGKMVEFFSVWASIVQTHEVDRSWKRIHTRKAYVDHSEDELEKKREHYVKVVQAFQSALQLLNGP